VKIKATRAAIQAAIAACAASVFACSSFAGVDGYYRWPTINGDTVVFSSEGDLWKTTTAGGVATRLTSHPGNEALAHLSPDGKRIAFTADYEGNSDIYVMSVDGGEPTRLTFHPSREDCVGWTPDGKYVLARSRRSGLNSLATLFKIPVDGSEPEPVNIGKAEYASFSPDGKMIAFNQFLWNGTWKRYRGGTAAKIWVGDLTTNKFWQLDKETAVEQYPTWVDGRIYFVSERTFPANLWSAKPDGSDAKQVTQHKDYDVRIADSDGKKIIYTVGADLWVLDPKTGESKKLETTIATDRIRDRGYVGDASKTMESYDLSQDGKRVVVTSRGEIWNAPAKPGGRVIQITDNDSGIRQRSGSISPDGKHIACITDETGEQEIALYDAAGKEKHRLLTKGGKGWLFMPIWSYDSKLLAYSDLTGTLNVVNVESGESKVIDQDKNWELTEYSFSPDNKWIVYTKVADNRTQTVWLCELATGKATTVSAGFTNDWSPTWDPQGKYLYFLSNRVYQPRLDDLDATFLVTQSAKPVVVILAKDGKSPLLPEEMLEEKKDEAKEDSATQAASKPSSEPTVQPTTSASTQGTTKPSDVQVKIDLDGIVGRAVELPVGPGNCTMLKAAENKVLWITSPTAPLAGDDDEPGPKGQLNVYDFKTRKADVWLEGVSSYTLSGDGKKLAWFKDGVISVVDATGKPGTVEEMVKVASLPLTIHPQDEWKQIYAEAWRLQRDFYWAENMVGVDWPAVRKKYEPLLERISSRGELNDVIGQLIGELGTSHTYVFGGDGNYTPPAPVPVGVLGADIDLEQSTGLHKFVRVLKPEPWETGLVAPLTMSHANVKEGDYLIAVNGRELAKNENADARFINQAGVEVLLTVCSKPDKSDARDIQVKTLKADQDLRYADWCRRNREYVYEKTGGKVGYFHLPNMGGEGLVKFIEGFYPQISKDALIIDDRSNGGGFVSQMILEKLDRKPLAYDKPRRGMVSTYPNRVHVGYKCVIIDQHAGSDGDIFPDTFKKLGLGPLIGKRTWGGVIGIRTDKGFVDSGMSSQPEFAWFDARGWSIENHGVDPDIEVEFTPEDYLAGRDPQLDRAIDEMMKKLAEKPVEKVTPPPFPIRNGQPAK
jgi:tricorn protease